MSVASLYNASCLSVDGTVVRDLSNLRYAEGLNVDADPGNQAKPSFVSVRGAKPLLGFSSRQIATLLDNFDSGCAWADVSAWTNPLVAYFQKRANTSGLVASGGAHRSLSVEEGLLLGRRLSASYQQYASMDLEMVAFSADGQASPYTLSATASLPSLGLDDERYTLGTALVGDEALSGLQSMELDFGLTADGVGGDSDIYDTYVSVSRYAPRFTFNGVNMDWLLSSGVAIGGKSATQANTTVYLRKCASRGKLVAVDVAEHIKFNAAGYLYIDEQSAANSDNGTCSAVLVVADDGTNAMLAVDTTSTIA